MMTYQQMVGRPKPSMVVPAGGEGKAVVGTRPITRQGLPVNGTLPEPPPLQYGDDSAVDEQNVTEVQTFRRYVAEKKGVPDSKVVLVDYYRQRLPAAS